jgi:hypothetical protein
MIEPHIRIDIAQQSLMLWQGNLLLRRYLVSTARNGPGEYQGSGCTPRGWHRIRLRIGENCPENTVFVGRRPSGEIYSQELATRYPERDWILSRILWLTGIESGRNRGRCMASGARVDTLRRYIYIHGCPDTEPLGVARSHGCIRMNNQDLLDLFERVGNGTSVAIF